MAFISLAAKFQPYCGAPPAPETLWARWNLDPLLIAGLALGLGACLVLCRSQSPAASPRTRTQTICLYAGWAVAALALVSPLCALSVSLSAARVAQHMALAAVAAPLVALGLPRRVSAPAFEALAAAAVFGAVLWFWQAPSPYDATFANAAVYWTMHLSAFGAALWLWSSLFDAGARFGEALAAAALTSLQMGLLGAILTFANRPLYSVHDLTTAAWGLSPLADQQLAGAVMWIPAGAILAAGLVGGLAATLRDVERRTGARPAPPELAR